MIYNVYLNRISFYKIRTKRTNFCTKNITPLRERKYNFLLNLFIIKYDNASIYIFLKIKIKNK